MKSPRRHKPAPTRPLKVATARAGRGASIKTFKQKLEQALTVSPDAYEPDFRARAVLRGVDYAQDDLRAAGGAYDVAQVRSLLYGVSRQAVDKKVADGSLLAVPGPSGRRRFPAIQFNDDGSLVQGLKDVQTALGYASRWSVLNFLVHGHDLLGGERPIDLLRKSQLDRVVQAAGRTGVHGG